MLVTFLGSIARIIIYRLITDLAVYASSVGIFLVMTFRLLYCANISLGWLCCLIFQQSWGHTCQRMASLSPSCPQKEQLSYPVPPAIENPRRSYCLWEEGLSGCSSALFQEPWQSYSDPTLCPKGTTVTSVQCCGNQLCKGAVLPSGPKLVLHGSDLCTASHCMTYAGS